MTIFDLIFLAVFFFTFGSLIAAGVLTFRGKGAAAMAVGRRLRILLAVYFAALIGVSLFTPGKTLQMNEDECFDDMCFAATSVQAATSTGNSDQSPPIPMEYVAVTVRVSNRGKARTQRALDAKLTLLDAAGREYSPSPKAEAIYGPVIGLGPQPPLASAVVAGGSFTTTRIFEVRPQTSPFSLVVHRGDFPGWFVIGDSASLLHKRTQILLAPDIKWSAVRFLALKPGMASGV